MPHHGHIKHGVGSPLPLALVLALALAWALASAGGCAQGVSADDPGEPRAKQAPRAPGARVEIAQRAGKVKNHPCSQCHDKIEPRAEPGPFALPMVGTHRELKMKHFEGAADCYLCHDRKDSDGLRLLTGETIHFDHSHRLCGQCHGEKLRDWKIGAHGKHVGSWQKVRHRLTCADCHDPHVPARAREKARPAPPMPERGIPKGAH